MKAKQLIALLCAASLTLSGCSLGKTNTTDSNSGNQTSQSEPNEPTSQTDTEIPADILLKDSVYSSSVDGCSCVSVSTVGST